MPDTYGLITPEECYTKNWDCEDFDCRYYDLCNYKSKRQIEKAKEAK